ncbi:MAG TPA: hypothetical protein VHD83_23825 [Puia sp.]|nr:hypothetical protein [Puia sp.]
MKTLFASLLLCALAACGGRNSARVTAEVSHVDSAAQSAPDTLRASMDTSSHKKDTVNRER